MEQGCRHAMLPVGWLHVDALQIAHRAGGGPFHIVMAQLALGKAHGCSALPGKEQRRVPLSQQIRKLRRQLLGGMFPQLRGQSRDVG